MNARNLVLTCAILAAAHTAFADEPAKPLLLKGGVSESRELTPDRAREAAERDRHQAEVQRMKDVNTFLDNPRVYRVSTVDPVEKNQSRQRIRAVRIRNVKIDQGGKVDLGEIVEDSGDTFEIPPGTLKVGDLFTQDQGQFIEVPKNHFDPLGGLSDVGSQQTNMSPTTVLMNAAKEMDRAATEAENNAMTAANHFTAGLAKWAGNTLNFLAQDRGDFGRPGKPAQDLLNYLTNDYNENDKALYDNAVKALDQLQKDPASFWGEQGPNLIPLGGLGKDAEIGRMMQAARRVSKVERTAQEFAGFQKGARQAQNAERAAAQRAQQRAQQAARSQPPERRSPPPEPRREQTAQQRQVEQQRAQAEARRQQQQRQLEQKKQQELAEQQSQQRQAEQQRAQADARQAQQQRQAEQQRQRDLAEKKNEDRAPAGESPEARQRRQAEAQRQQQQRDRLAQNKPQPSQDPPLSKIPENPDPIKGDTVKTPAPDPMKGDTVPSTPAADPFAKGDTAPTTPAADPAPPAGPPLAEQFQSALNQDAAFGAQPAPKTTPPFSDDMIDALRKKFGSDPKDPMHGAPGLLAARQGIPVETSPDELVRAFKAAGPNARGIVFASYPDGTSKILNARNVNNIPEITDPIAPSKTPDLATTEKLWFYRTN